MLADVVGAVVSRSSLVVTAALLFAACAGTRSPDGPPIPEGRVALRFERIDGRVMTLGELRGRVVLVTVITTWADVALTEVPELKRLSAKYPESELAIVAIALDEKAEMARIFARTFEVPYIVAIVEDRGTFTSEQGPLGPIRIIPTSFLIDREGRIAARMEGTWPDGALDEAIRELTRR
jgi:peroxiredoxin